MPQDISIQDPVAETSSSREVPVRELVRQASNIIAPVWPLKSFVACNPLQGLEDLPFEEAVETGRQLFGGRGYLAPKEYRTRISEGRIDKKILRQVFDERLGGRLPELTLGGVKIDAETLLWRHLIQGLFGKQSSASPAAELNPLTSLVNRQTIKWCVAFFDEGVATLPMPGRQQGLYRAWRALAPHDSELQELADERGASVLKSLAKTPEAAIKRAFDILDIEDPSAHLTRHLGALHGWAGYIKWRADSKPSGFKKAPTDLVDYLALRLTIEALAVKADPLRYKSTDTQEPSSTPVTRRFDHLASKLNIKNAALARANKTEKKKLLTLLDKAEAHDFGPIWLTASEETYRSNLLGKLEQQVPRAVAKSDPATQNPQAQLLFCIDVRSEPFRRHLEALGPYDTFGYAGFFGIPMRHHPTIGNEVRDLCPALVKPKHDVAEQPLPGQLTAAQTLESAQARKKQAKTLYGKLKANVATSFALVEATGVFSGLSMLARTLAPRSLSQASKRLTQKPLAEQAYTPTIQTAYDEQIDRLVGFTLKEQVAYAKAMFEMTGLEAPFGRLLVLCGHGGSTVNNPFASTINCGACGGHSGAANARTMAAILNRPEVREQLAEEGIKLPDNCIALAAEHDTTTDEVTLFGTDQIPASHAEDLAQLWNRLDEAGKKNRAYRIKGLPGASSDPDSHMTERSTDWAQVRPEWGLARNAAFIAAPRRLTEQLDLEGRCFLHSYDWQQDPEGDTLEAILTAPMVVGEWINTQYYFSTVDNTVYGSGSKVTQNVVGGIGVMQGNASDLMDGLPWQSVYDEDGRPYHDPLRLMTTVLAPVEQVEEVIAANDYLQQLFDNNWVALHVLDPETKQSLRYQSGLTWDEAPSYAPTPD